MKALNDRQEAILQYILSVGPERVYVAADFPGASARSTAARDVAEMVAAGLLAAEGTTKGRTYRLARDARPYIEWDLSRPPEDRAIVPYNPDFLGRYEPNVSSFLSHAQIRVLHAVSFAGNYGVKATDDAVYGPVLARMLIDLAHASSRLEDVRISWLETKNLIEFAVATPQLSATDRTIVLNHKDAIKFLIRSADEMSISPRDVRDLHSLLAKGLIADDKAVGALRRTIVHFGDSRYRPIDIPDQLDVAFTAFCEKATAIQDPFEQAFFVMVGLPYLQPFQDVNKRTSRLTMNLPFIQKRLPPFSFAKLDRTEYMLGLLAVYERTNVSILADAFVTAYKANAPTYRDLMQHVQEGGVLGTLSTPAVEPHVRAPADDETTPEDGSTSRP